GLVTGVSRVVARIAQGRNVVLQGVPQTRGSRDDTRSSRNVFTTVVIIWLIMIALGRIRRPPRGGLRRSRPWSGWNSGVRPFGGGPFGGGFGGFGGGGGGGGFGGFGGGRSGGGGGGGGW